MMILRVAKLASFLAKKAFKNKTFQKVIFNVLKDYGFKMLNDKLSDNDSEPKSVNFEATNTTVEFKLKEDKTVEVSIKRQKPISFNNLEKALEYVIKNTKK